MNGDSICMGAWGHEIFDNDAACDWLDSLLVRDDLSLIKFTFDQINQAENEIDADAASAALAACEALAHLRGRPGLHEASLDHLKQWANQRKHLDTDYLVPQAAQALAQIRSEECQLQQQWKQTENYEKWVATVEDVARRIG